MNNVEYRSQFTDKQWGALHWASLGFSFLQSCRKAGYLAPEAAVGALKKNKIFMSALDKQLGRNKQDMKMTREKVQAMVLAAYDVARETMDANAMVRAASEINKMCGFYEVEKAEIELNQSKSALIGRLNELSDSELLLLSQEAESIDPEADQLAEAEHLELIVDAEFVNV